jgi:hypothetical protein
MSSFTDANRTARPYSRHRLHPKISNEGRRAPPQRAPLLGRREPVPSVRLLKRRTSRVECSSLDQHGHAVADRRSLMRGGPRPSACRLPGQGGARALSIPRRGRQIPVAPPALVPGSRCGTSDPGICLYAVTARSKGYRDGNARQWSVHTDRLHPAVPSRYGANTRR